MGMCSTMWGNFGLFSCLIRLADNEVHNVKLKLVANREKDGRTYNVPTVLEVAALIAVILIRIQEEILFLRLEMANYKRYMNCILVI